eukprot:1451738-Rhodomonas_salina.1
MFHSGARHWMLDPRPKSTTCVHVAHSHLAPWSTRRLDGVELHLQAAHRMRVLAQLRDSEDEREGGGRVASEEQDRNISSTWPRKNKVSVAVALAGGTDC